MKLPYCPSCQMPFAILSGTTPMHHLEECAQLGRSQQQAGMMTARGRGGRGWELEGEVRRWGRERRWEVVHAVRSDGGRGLGRRSTMEDSGTQ